MSDTREVYLSVDRGIHFMYLKTVTGSVQLACWHRSAHCNSSCAAFQIHDHEVHCLALPVLAAQCIAHIADSVTPKKTLLDAHAEAVETAEKDEEEEA